MCWSCGPCCPCPGSEPCHAVPVPSEAPSQGLQCSWVTRASPAHPVCLPEQGGFRYHPRLCCDLAAWASLLPAPSPQELNRDSCGAPLSGNVSGQILLLECSASSPHPAEVLAFEQCWLDGPMLEGSPWCVLAMTQAAHSQARVALPHRVTPNTDFGLKPKMKH